MKILKNVEYLLLKFFLTSTFDFEGGFIALETYIILYFHEKKN